jgi:protein-S-isoprenylcysteine O-methyltransferase Ste14
VTLIPTAIAQVIFYAVFIIWLAFTFLIERIIVGNESRGTARTREDRGSALLIYFSVFVSLIVAFGFAGAGITPLPDRLFIVGIFLMLLGIFVREWAVTTLRGYYSFRVSVREDHKVIESGPYRLVRHPAYSGSILTMVGIGLAVQSSAAVLLLLVFCGIAYGYRMRVEETALLKELGEEYSKYMSRTKRLIPFIF